MVQRSAKQVWGQFSEGSLQSPALVEALLKDPEVAGYLTQQELAELTQTDYYVRYIDTAFKRIGL